MGLALPHWEGCAGVVPQAVLPEHLFLESSALVSVLRHHQKALLILPLQLISVLIWTHKTTVLPGSQVQGICPETTPEACVGSVLLSKPTAGQRLPRTEIFLRGVCKFCVCAGLKLAGAALRRWLV